MNSAKEYITSIILSGTPLQKKELYGFDNETNEQVLKKFKLFVRGNFIRYLKEKDAPFHDVMSLNYIKSYRGENYINLGFRGCAKTSLFKLFLVFVILNDKAHSKKYIKVLSKDIKNPRQIVTDVYNMCLELRSIYGDVFEKEGDKKREETMASFTLVSGVKLTAGTVGQTQRGHVQDAYRPDWLFFDDVEDRETISSIAITEGIISKCDEAITGLAKGVSWCLSGNYISETGVVQSFIDKSDRILQITPIEIEGVPTWEIFTVEDIAKLKKDSLDFYGEYMCDPSRTGDKFFDIDRIDADLKNVREPIQKHGETKYWGHFIEHHRYGIGADTSEGIGRDSSALTLWNFRTGELMASYDSNTIKPELFAYEMARVGREFGNCIVAPEINNMSGGIVITTLRQIYQNVYRFTDRGNVVEKESMKYGWHTNARTKPQMFFDFRKDYNDGLVKIYDKRLLQEMKMYSNSDLSESGITRHFDLLTSAVIGWQMKHEDEQKKVATVSYHSY